MLLQSLNVHTSKNVNLCIPECSNSKEWAMCSTNSMTSLVQSQNHSTQQNIYNTKSYACVAEIPSTWQQWTALSFLLELISIAKPINRAFKIEEHVRESRNRKWKIRLRMSYGACDRRSRSSRTWLNEVWRRCWMSSKLVWFSHFNSNKLKTFLLNLIRAITVVCFQFIFFCDKKSEN